MPRDSRDIRNSFGQYTFQPDDLALTPFPRFDGLIEYAVVRILACYSNLRGYQLYTSDRPLTDVQVVYRTPRWYTTEEDPETGFIQRLGMDWFLPVTAEILGNFHKQLEAEARYGRRL